MAKKAKPAAKKSKQARKAAKAKKVPSAGARSKAPKKAANKKAPARRSKPKSSWFDVASQKPLIADETRRLKTFLAAVADGVIDQAELEAQEERLVAAMKEVEPLLDADLHAKVTRLLCELTAYDLMQVMHSFHEARPQSVFQG